MASEAGDDEEIHADRDAGLHVNAARLLVRVARVRLNRACEILADEANVAELKSCAATLDVIESELLITLHRLALPGTVVAQRR